MSFYPACDNQACTPPLPRLAQQVVIIKPGPVQTLIWARGKETFKQALAGLPPLVQELYGKTIDRVGMKGARIPITQHTQQQGEARTWQLPGS